MGQKNIRRENILTCLICTWKKIPTLNTMCCCLEAFSIRYTHSFDGGLVNYRRMSEGSIASVPLHCISTCHQVEGLAGTSSSFVWCQSRHMCERGGVNNRRRIVFMYFCLPARLPGVDAPGGRRKPTNWRLYISVCKRIKQTRYDLLITELRRYW